MPVRVYPSLRREVYFSGNINLALEDDVLRFVSDPNNVQIDREHGVVRVSLFLNGLSLIFRKGIKAAIWPFGTSKMNKKLFLNF